MTELDLDAVEARANAATPEPWDVGDGTEIGLGIEPITGGGFYFDAIVAQVTYSSERDGDRQRAANRGVQLQLSAPDADAEFIARARTDVPALVAEVKRQQSLFRAADTAAGIQARRAERAEGKLITLIARLHQMADAWDADLPETIRREAASGAIRATLETADA